MSYEVGQPVAVITPGEGANADLEVITVQAVRTQPDGSQVITVEALDIAVDAEGLGRHESLPVAVSAIDWHIQQQLDGKTKISVAPSNYDENPLDLRPERRDRPRRGPNR